MYNTKHLNIVASLNSLI